MLRALCIDLMDTLVSDPYREALRAGTGLDADELEALRDPGAWPAFETALIDEAEFARRFFATPPGPHRPGRAHRLDMAAFNRARRAGYGLVEGMVELLDALEGHVERYVATNYPVWVVEVVEAFGLDQRTEGVYASHHFGVRKPAAAFYERLLGEIRHRPEHCLLVDDRGENCAGARAVGMRAHLFTGVSGLRARLRGEGLPL